MRWVAVGVVAIAPVFAAAAGVMALEHGWDAMVASIWPDGVLALAVTLAITAVMAAVMVPLFLWADRK